jgi:hypothetical protein
MGAGNTLAGNFYAGKVIAGNQSRTKLKLNLTPKNITFQNSLKDLPGYGDSGKNIERAWER